MNQKYTNTVMGRLSKAQKQITVKLEKNKIRQSSTSIDLATGLDGASKGWRCGSVIVHISKTPSSEKSVLGVAGVWKTHDTPSTIPQLWKTDSNGTCNSGRQHTDGEVYLTSGHNKDGDSGV